MDIHTHGHRFPGRCSCWELEFRNCGAIPGRGLLLTAERGIEGMWGDCGGNCLRRKAGQPWKQGDTAESHIAGRAITIAFLTTHASISSWTRERRPSNTWHADLQSRAPASGAPLCAWRSEQQRKTPGKRRLAEEAFWPPATRGSIKDPDRAITPAAEAVRVPAHLAPPGSPQAKQLYLLHAQLSLGHCCQRQKKSCTYAHRVASVVSNSLWPCSLGPARLVCQGVSPGRNTGAYWPLPFAIPF